MLVVTIAFLAAAPISEAARAAEVLLGPYTGDEHARRLVVVREPRLNRTYDASVSFPERADPDAGKKKRARVPEVELSGPIAAPPLRSVRPRDDSGPSRDLGGGEDARAGRLPEGTTFRVERSESSSSSSSDRAASRTEGAEAEDLGRTASQVDKAIGTIGLTGLAAAESSSEASASRVRELNTGGLGEVPPTPQFGGGKLSYYSFCLFVAANLLEIANYYDY